MEVYQVSISELKKKSEGIYEYRISTKGEIPKNLASELAVEGLEMRLTDLAIEQAKINGDHATLILNLE